MVILDDMKEEIKDRALDAINSGGTEGVSLREICEELFNDSDSEEYIQINKSHVFEVLDELLEEGHVSFDDEQDLWISVD